MNQNESASILQHIEDVMEKISLWSQLEISPAYRQQYTMLFCQECASPIELSLEEIRESSEQVAQLLDLLGVDLTETLRPLLDIDLKSSDPRSISVAEEVFVQIFEIAGDKFSRDFPICTECACMIETRESQGLLKLKNEISTYKSTLRDYSEEPIVDAVDIEGIKQMEESAMKEVEEIKRMKEQIRAEYAVLNDLNSLVDGFFDSYWENFKTLEEGVLIFSKEGNSTARKLENLEQFYEAMKKTNVLDDSYNIYYDGHFATINGYHCGRLLSCPHDWDTINVALGEAVHLLYCIEGLTPNFQFSKCELIPRGSFSKIVRKSDSTSFEL